MLPPSNSRPAAPSPAANTPSVAPSDPRSLLTVPSKKFVTQTLAPSKATPKGPLPTANVPSTAPVAPSSFVTVSLMLFATQRLAPSQAAPSGRVPDGYVGRVVPPLVSFVTVEPVRFNTQTSPPPLTRPPGPPPTLNVPSALPSLGLSFVTVLSPRFATQMPEASASTATGRLPTETVPSVAPSLARTRVNVFLNCDATHSEAPWKASASAPPPEPATSGTSRRMGISLDPGAPSGCPVGAWDDLWSGEDEGGTGERVTTSASPPARRWCVLEEHSEHAESTRVAREDRGGVLVGRKRDRVEEDVSPEPIPEELLDLDEVRGGDRARAVRAVRVHEIDDDLPIFDQVVVEANLLALVGDELHVREMVALEPLSRIHPRPGSVDSVGVRARLPRPRRHPGGDGRHTECCQSRPPCHP